MNFNKQLREIAVKKKNNSKSDSPSKVVITHRKVIEFEGLNSYGHKINSEKKIGKFEKNSSCPQMITPVKNVGGLKSIYFII